MIIEANALAKDYVINVKGKGLKGMAKSLFHSEKKLVRAVQDVDLKIDEGELVGYIGPNGAGKSTTIKMLSGILAPTGGKREGMRYRPAEKEDSKCPERGCGFWAEDADVVGLAGTGDI